jgi:uncharacterized membrane protein
MSDSWLVVFALALCTFGIRLSGILLGQRLPTHGAWARALNALPGCLIVALVTNLVLSGGPNEWIAGTLALATAMATRNLLITMAVGIAAIALARLYLF